MYITNDIRYVGVNDHTVDLFEGQYVVPNGMAYNSYVILDDLIAVMDTVDARFTHEWLDNIQSVLNGRTPNFLVVQHMEPDHSANIVNFLKVYPDTILVASSKAFTMMKNFFGKDFTENGMIIKEGDTLNLGKHVLHFVAAPMVHWPEVMVTYDSTDKVLFSADGFGKFGALDVEEWVSFKCGYPSLISLLLTLYSTTRMKVSQLPECLFLTRFFCAMIWALWKLSQKNSR